MMAVAFADFLLAPWMAWETPAELPLSDIGKTIALLAMMEQVLVQPGVFLGDGNRQGRMNVSMFPTEWEQPKSFVRFTRRRARNRIIVEMSLKMAAQMIFAWS